MAKLTFLLFAIASGIVPIIAKDKYVIAKLPEKSLLARLQDGDDHLTANNDYMMAPKSKNKVVGGVCAEEKGVTGLCKLKKFPRWTYNKETGKCEKFLYNGCGGQGNGNNFKSKRKCKKKCEKECVCPYKRKPKPVCGKDGETYANACLAKCEGVKKMCNGKCPCKGDSCEYGGKTYKHGERMPCDECNWTTCSNGQPGGCTRKECFREPSPIEIWSCENKTEGAHCQVSLCKASHCYGKCSNGVCQQKPICSCTYLVDPVCGENGKEYVSSCDAECEGVKKYCKGKCPCKASTPIEIWSCENKTEGAACQVSLCKAPHCWGKCSNGVCQQKSLVCKHCFGYSHDPVCGENGKEYDNSCEAKCQGVKNYCKGKCPCKDCSVPLIHEPVCGEDGKTYGNSYEAACDGIKVECKETCPCIKSCRCPKINKPVCGETKGVIGGEREYGNACLAKCKGVKKMCNGKCPCKGSDVDPTIFPDIWPDVANAGDEGRDVIPVDFNPFI